jgi:hypothetical protein
MHKFIFKSSFYNQNECHLCHFQNSRIWTKIFKICLKVCHTGYLIKSSKSYCSNDDDDSYFLLVRKSWYKFGIKECKGFPSLWLTLSALHCIGSLSSGFPFALNNEASYTVPLILLPLFVAHQHFVTIRVCYVSAGCWQPATAAL